MDGASIQTKLTERLLSLLTEIEVVSYYNDSGTTWMCPFCKEEVDGDNKLIHDEYCELIACLNELKRLEE